MSYNRFFKDILNATHHAELAVDQDTSLLEEEKRLLLNFMEELRDRIYGGELEDGTKAFDSDDLEWLMEDKHA